MAQVYKKLEIDVNKETNDIITAVQNDAKSRYLDIVLLDGSTAINLIGHEVRIYGEKADGTEIYNNGEITDAITGRCQFELTSQALAVAQDLEVQIVLFKNNVEVLSTHPFKIHVVKSLLSDSAIESNNEYGALVVLYQNLYEAYDLMTDMVQNMGEKGVISTTRNIDTFWQVLEYMTKYMDTDLTTLLNDVLSNANVQGVIDRLGNAQDTGASETTGSVMGKLNALLSSSVIKSVQRGHAVNDVASTTVTISPVDINKSVVIVNGSAQVNATKGIVSFYYGVLTSPTQLTVGGGGLGESIFKSTNAYWQVIEFY